MASIAKIAAVWALGVALAACGGGKGGTTGNDVYWPDTGDQETAGGDVTQPEGSGGNRPPVLYKIGDKTVAAGAELVITLKAEDPDGDSLSYNVYGSVPPSAKLLKDSGEFRWTPEAQYAGQSLYLTFVVADGRGGYDRETVEIAVTAQGQNHAPKFQKLGDQAVQADQHFELRLVATDPDSDALSYAVQGSPPAGAALEASTGRFTWEVPAGTEGQAFPVSFTVSDGTLSDALTVRFVVAGGTGNHAPTFQKLDEVKATAGQPVSFKVSATDPDNDPLTYGVEEDSLPAGAQFDATEHRFNWTPTDAQAGQAYQVTFHVEDGNFSAYLEVTIVVAKAVTADCQADAQEPNDTAQAAKPLQAGTHDLTLCPQEGQPDLDLFAVTLPKDARLTARSHAAQAEVNLDLEVAAQDAPGTLLAYGWSDGADEVAKFQAAKAGTYLLSVYQYGGDPTSDTTGYTLTLTIEPDYLCQDDPFEQNDSAWGAYELPTSYLGQDLDDLHLCPGDADWFSVELLVGQGLEAGITFDQAGGDLDLYLLEPDAESVVESSATSEPQENVKLMGATQGGLYYLVVEGYPAETTENTYTLRVDLLGGPACQPDQLEPNDDDGHATGIPDDSQWQGLTLCADADWFATTVYPFETFMAEAQAIGGTVKLEVRGPDGTGVLASGNGSVEWTAGADGSEIFLVATGPVGVTYSLDVIFISGD